MGGTGETASSEPWKGDRQPRWGVNREEDGAGEGRDGRSKSESARRQDTISHKATGNFVFPCFGFWLLFLFCFSSHLYFLFFPDLRGMDILHYVTTRARNTNGSHSSFLSFSLFAVLSDGLLPIADPKKTLHGRPDRQFTY